MLRNTLQISIGASLTSPDHWLNYPDLRLIILGLIIFSLRKKITENSLQNYQNYIHAPACYFGASTPSESPFLLRRIGTHTGTNRCPSCEMIACCETSMGESSSSSLIFGASSAVFSAVASAMFSAAGTFSVAAGTTVSRSPSGALSVSTGKAPGFSTITPAISLATDVFSSAPPLGPTATSISTSTKFPGISASEDLGEPALFVGTIRRHSLTWVSTELSLSGTNSDSSGLFTRCLFLGGSVPVS